MSEQNGKPNRGSIADAISRRSFFVSAAAAATAATVPPWLRSAQAAPSAADIDSASGGVKALVWEGYEYADAFKNLSDVSIEAAYLAANEDTISKTGTPGAFDLVTIYQGMIDPLRHLDRIEPIDTSLLSNFGKLFPFFRDIDGLRRDGELYGVPYTWGTMMVLYDADQTDAPKNFDDLMAPALTGKIAVPDDAYAVITTFARYAGIENANRLSPEQLQTVMDLLNRFKPQILSVAPSYGELPAMYSRGEIAVSLPDWTPTVMAAKEAGKDVRSTIPSEGAFSFIDSWMVVKGATNEAGAYAVINEAIGTHAQTEMAAYSGLGIVNQEAASGLSEEVAQAWSYDDLSGNFDKAPIYPGAPIEPEDGVTTYQDWIKAWTEFKAG